MLKKGYSEDYRGSKLYFTEADASSQILYGISLPELDIKLKLWLLLNDYIILSTGHMIESNTTFTWLTNTPGVTQLASELAILPSLRDDRDSFEEFILESPAEEDKPSLLRDNRKLLLQRAKYLDSIFEKCITWSSVDESEWFRDDFIKDLKTATSPLRRRLVGISSSSITGLAEEMANCNFLTRDKLQDMVARHCPQRQTVLLKYRDLYYYMSGAITKDADPVLHPQAAMLCREKVSYEMRLDKEGQHVDDYWRHLLNLWNISIPAISRLTIRDILDIRKDAIGRRVRKTWKKLTDEARSSVSNIDTIEGFNNSRNELLYILGREMASQRDRHALFKKTRHRIEIVSWVTSGVGVLATCFAPPSLSLTALGAATLLVNKPIIDAIEKRTPSTEFILLSSKIN